MKLLTGAYCVGLLFFGVCNTITSKTQYMLTAPGADGKERTFDKPYFQSIVMFVAMMVVLIPHYMNETIERMKSKKATGKSTPFSVWLKIGVPAIFDFAATTVAAIGLIWVMASVYQMLRGGLTVFACLLSIKYLEKKVKKYEWYAIGSICVGLVVVGVASVFGSGDEQQNSWVIQLYGVLLILLGQAIQAAQMVVEEHLLKNVDAPPLLMVGVEGIWGILIMAPVMWIIQYTPSCTDDSIGCQLDQKVFHEDSTESFRMVGESESIRWVLVIYFMGILFFNICGLQVWLVDLFFYYGLGPVYGHDTMLKVTSAERLTWWSLVQFVGFIFLIFGTLLYNKVIVLPNYFDYPTTIEYTSIITSLPSNEKDNINKTKDGYQQISN